MDTTTGLPADLAPSMARRICSEAVSEPPGEFTSTRSYAFEFNNVEMPYESYNGVNVRLKCAHRCCRCHPHGLSAARVR